LFIATEASVAMVEDDGQLQWLREGYLVRFDGYIDPLPDSTEFEADNDRRPFRRVRAALNRSDPEREERKRRQSMIGGGRFIGLARIVSTSGTVGSQIIGLDLVSDYVMVYRKKDFARRATVFGWVTGNPQNDPYGLVLETRNGGPQIDVSYRAQSTSSDEGNVVVAKDDKDDSRSGTTNEVVQPQKPVELAASVRPICIYR
jgi:hypothetical protein